MPRLPLVALEDFPPGLLDALQRGRASGMLSTSIPVQVWAHRPAVAQAWLQALEQMHSHSPLPARLRELVRLKIASITNCVACQLARKTDSVDEADLACLASDNERFSAPERAALRYAELFACDYTAIDDAVYAELKAHFGVPEIVELNLYCALMLAGGRMTYVQQAYEEGVPMTASLYDIPLERLNGEPTTLGAWRGQALLIVNVASKCGLTPQYAGLEALHERYRARGLQVLGFPCNDFAGQEPGGAAEIQAFCDTQYHVSFPLFAKLRINSAPRHALYAALIAAQPQARPSGSDKLRSTLAEHKLLPPKDSDVMWNFEKFLVGRDGRVMARFAPDVTPEDPALVAAVESTLAAGPGQS